MKIEESECMNVFFFVKSRLAHINCINFTHKWRFGQFPKFEVLKNVTFGKGFSCRNFEFARFIGMALKLTRTCAANELSLHLFLNGSEVSGQRIGKPMGMIFNAEKKTDIVMCSPTKRFMPDFLVSFFFMQDLAALP